MGAAPVTTQVTEQAAALAAAKPPRPQQCPKAAFCLLSSLLAVQKQSWKRGQKKKKSIFMQKDVGSPQLLVRFAEGRGEMVAADFFPLSF